MKIHGNHENQSFCNTFHVKSMTILVHNLLEIKKLMKNRNFGMEGVATID